MKTAARGKVSEPFGGHGGASEAQGASYPCRAGVAGDDGQRRRRGEQLEQVVAAGLDV
jgi:hypothetical protein